MKNLHMLAGVSHTATTAFVWPEVQSFLLICHRHFLTKSPAEVQQDSSMPRANSSRSHTPLTVLSSPLDWRLLCWPEHVHAWGLPVQGLPDLHDRVPRVVQLGGAGEQLQHLHHQQLSAAAKPRACSADIMTSPAAGQDAADLC